MKHLIPFVIASAALNTSTANAQNLIANPGFDDNYVPEWAASDTVSGVAWDSVDEGNSPDSGSLLFMDVGEFGALVSQCVHISNGLPTQAQYSYFIPPEVMGVAFGPVLVIRYSDAEDCAGFLSSDIIFAETPLIQSVWTRETAMISPPGGTLSISFGITFPGSGASDDMVLVDNAFLGDLPLFADGFEF